MRYAPIKVIMGSAKVSLTALTTAAKNVPQVIYGMSPSLPRQSFVSQGQQRCWQSTYRGDNKDTDKNDRGAILYLHIGPSGDCWTGHSIFAAKHLQPDYVRSVALPANFRNDERVEALLEAIGEDSRLQHQIYDDENIPESLFDKIRADVPDDC